MAAVNLVMPNGQSVLRSPKPSVGHFKVCGGKALTCSNSTNSEPQHWTLNLQMNGWASQNGSTGPVSLKLPLCLLGMTNTELRLAQLGPGDPICTEIPRSLMPLCQGRHALANLLLADVLGC